MEVILQIVYRILRQLARTSGAPIGYGQLSERYQAETGDWVDPHFGWIEPLFQILQWCDDNGLPQLPALVINMTEQGRFSGLPGNGFWGQSNTPANPSVEAWIEMCNAVYAAAWPEEME